MISRFRREYPQSTFYVFDEIYNLPIDHSQKPEWLLEAIAFRLSHQKPFAPFTFTLEDRVWSKLCDRDEQIQITKFLEQNEFIKGVGYKIIPSEKDPQKNIRRRQYMMTVKGWAKLAPKLRDSSNRVFIATKFKWGKDEEVLHERAMAEIKRACRDCGYEASIVTSNHLDPITDKILVEIKQARFVIAEFTYNNRGVYCEAGFARGLGIPVIHLVKKGHADHQDDQEKYLHFDIRQINYLEWDNIEEIYPQLADRIIVNIGKYRA